MWELIKNDWDIQTATVFDTVWYDRYRLLHEVGHVLEELDVGVVVPLVHLAAIPQHLGEDAVLVYGPVLHAAFARPDDLLLLFESFVEEKYLERKRVFRLNATFR